MDHAEELWDAIENGTLKDYKFTNNVKKARKGNHNLVPGVRQDIRNMDKYPLAKWIVSQSHTGRAMPKRSDIGLLQRSKPMQKMSGIICTKRPQKA